MTISQLRDSARQIWEAALVAADPRVSLRDAVRLTDSGFAIGDSDVVLKGRLIVIGAGKAAARMSQAVEELLGDRVSGGLVITKYGHALPTERIEITQAAHPVPDQAGIDAVNRLRRLLGGLTPDDVVLCLLSGGASALFPSPAEGVTLEQKQFVTSRLLRAGATISELNSVRKHLSATKGGRLVEWVAPARLVSLIMSDVIGDPLDVIASGPTVPDSSTFEEALEVVNRYGVRVPRSVLERLQRGSRGEIAETPKQGDPVFEKVSNHVISNNQRLIEAAFDQAVQSGFETAVLSAEVQGEAREVAGVFAAIAREVDVRRDPLTPPACLVAGGETTVTVAGSGSGGRNQEMALAWAIQMRVSNQMTCFASIASDGTDGPTGAAGGLVDTDTCRRAQALGLDPPDYLRRNDSFTFLKAVGDSIVTGPTQTNLMDLQILLMA